MRAVDFGSVLLKSSYNTSYIMHYYVDSRWKSLTKWFRVSNNRRCLLGKDSYNTIVAKLLSVGAAFCIYGQLSILGLTRDGTRLGQIRDRAVDLKVLVRQT